ncbi:UPF0187-domain-containing protein [Coccomyxa subellipsoidea C-169]|uniref:UPF0187-domain-containing protein n=1 Tax=Coccomyxa subellipsoidea (strain C-169) TaxID=574566 RepID=I0YPV1_COCSC|nr:UPF0187-domain-containing protein [Coccomyxa subellipsoidea C-169]EIE20420.1 UPF0187-domain-containing protein [Coccomyxa subellipsoidea C-169]|eukprot:XP_005644964.1 UPF0187-domain-containing protein [Coccomyxa subellipsoidea C-169]
MKWGCTGGGLPLFKKQAANSERKKKNTPVPGGAGTTKLAILRDENSSIPWKNYWFATLFALHGRAFPVVPMLIYSGYVILAVALIKLHVDDFNNYKELTALSSPVDTIGLALFLLLTFRTQTAYERWWEGRRAWGNIMATCCDLCRISEAYIDDGIQASQLVTWTTVFAVAVKQDLHYSRDMSEVSDMLSIGEMRKMLTCDDLPLYAIRRCTHVLRANIDKYVGSLEIMVEADNRLRTLLDELDNCLRIRNTPMPWAYVVHLRAFLILWLCFLPVAQVTTLGWYTIPISIAVGYELLGYEEIGVEIENPFGTDFSDLPLEGLTATIAANAQEFLHFIRERGSPDDGKGEAPPPVDMAAAKHMDRAKSDMTGVKLKERSASFLGIKLKERSKSQSAIAAAHVLHNKAALSKMTEHHQESCRQPLYDKLGGQPAVMAAVEIFYKKLLGDVRVARFFNNISIERLKVRFLTYALGGADEYVGKDPTISHRRLHNEKGLGVQHFYVVVGHLQDTLRELGVSEDLIGETTAVLAPMEKTFGCESEQPCAHKVDRQDSAKVGSQASGDDNAGQGSDGDKSEDKAEAERDVCPF